MEQSLEQQVYSGGVLSPPERTGLMTKVFRSLLGAGLVVGLAACGGGGEPGSSDVAAAGGTTTETTADDLETTTSTTAPADVSGQCLSTDELNNRVWGGELVDGVQIPDAESTQANLEPERAAGSDIVGCVYEFKFTELFISTTGDEVQNTDDVTLEYRSGRYTNADSLVSDLYQRYSEDGKQVQILNYEDTSSFVLVEDGAFEFRYVDGDRVCFGRASSSLISNESMTRLNDAANLLAATVVCDLDVPLPIAPESTTTTELDYDASELPEGIPQLAPGEIWVDEKGFQWQGQESGPPVNVGQGA